MYEQGVDETTEKEAVAASEAFAGYVRDVVDERRAHAGPGDDLVSHLLETDLSDDELIASVVLLLNAGHEASVNVFGNGLNALLTHPDQLERITSGEVPMATALEELIRFDAPLQLFERTAVEDVEVGGVEVRAGQKVACLMGSANRDDAVFPQADQLDVGRDPNPHVASAWACTSASARRWPAWSWRSRSAACWSASRASASPAPRRAAPPGCCAASRASRLC